MSCLCNAIFYLSFSSYPVLSFHINQIFSDRGAMRRKYYSGKIIATLSLMYRCNTWGESGVTLSTIINAAILEVYHVAEVKRR